MAKNTITVTQEAYDLLAERHRELHALQNATARKVFDLENELARQTERDLERFTEALSQVNESILARVGKDALFLAYGGWEQLTVLLRRLVELKREGKIMLPIYTSELDRVAIFTDEFEQLVKDAEASLI